jgi:hypothetical protein
MVTTVLTDQTAPMVRKAPLDRLVPPALRVLMVMPVHLALTVTTVLMVTTVLTDQTAPTAQLDLKDLPVLLAFRALMGTKARLDLKGPPDQQEIWALTETMARTVKTVRTQTSSSLAPEKRCSLMATG